MLIHDKYSKINAQIFNFIKSFGIKRLNQIFLIPGKTLLITNHFN